MAIIKRSFDTPDRENPDWIERWKGEDLGLITSWEVGRKLRESSPDIAEKAKNGELPVLGFKGGVEKNLKLKIKYGSLNYLAQWQALRGEDLNIDTDLEYEITCKRTGVVVVFGSDLIKLSSDIP